MRVFIALDLPPEILSAVDKAAAPLRAGIGSLVRWVPVENIHITLKFLGEAAPGNVELLAQMLRAEAERIAPFEMSVGGIGAFPSRKRPRVIFVGIQVPAGLEALRRGIESACGRLGYAPDERGFRPHLTLGRVNQHVTLADGRKISLALESTAIDSPGTARVDSVQLYKSELKPTGAVYTRLFTAPFQKR
jgi:2'-5' RNA ligase